MYPVTVKLPLNANSFDEHLFSPYTTYYLEPLRVLELKDVFVTHTGLSVDCNGLIKETHHSYPEKYKDFLAEAKYYFQLAEKDNSNYLIELDNDNTYLQINHPWSANYWHWMTEAILRIWLVKESIGNMILLLPEYLSKIEFVCQSIKPFKFKDIYIIPANKSVMVNNLCIPQIKPIADSYFYNDCNDIKSFYLNYVKENNITANEGDKLYISRRKSSKRRVVNEIEVEEILKHFNFNIIHNEDYDFFQQVAVFSNAKYLVSIHGAGLTNMHFMKDNSSILELHKKKTNDSDWHSFAFWYLAEALNHKYYHQVCEPLDKNASFFDADIVVDLSELEKNLILMK